MIFKKGQSIEIPSMLLHSAIIHSNAEYARVISNNSYTRTVNQGNELKRKANFKNGFIGEGLFESMVPHAQHISPLINYQIPEERIYDYDFIIDGVRIEIKTKALDIIGKTYVESYNKMIPRHEIIPHTIYNSFVKYNENKQPIGEGVINQNVDMYCFFRLHENYKTAKFCGCISKNKLLTNGRFYKKGETETLIDNSTFEILGDRYQFPYTETEEFVDVFNEVVSSKNKVL